MPRLNAPRLLGVVEEMINCISSNDDVIFGLSTVRCVDGELFEHSVNVCLLSLALGCALNFNRKQLRELGLGALLHDLGKVFMVDLMRKDGPLNKEEWERMKQHPQLGYDVLRKQFDVSLLSCHVAFQHHERLDGSGYPPGLRGEDIHDYAKVCAIADYWDAVTHDRPYRPRLEHEEVLETLAGLAGAKLDARMVRKFVTIVARYPTGSIVRLREKDLHGGQTRTGPVGVVIAQSRADPERPVVRVVSDADYILIEPVELDLTAHPEYEVERVLEDYPLKIQEQLRQRSTTRA